MDSNNIYKSNLISRDLSWLNFNYRVLDQAKSDQRSILDRLKFLSIVMYPSESMKAAVYA